MTKDIDRKQCASQNTQEAYFKFLNSRNGYYVSGPKMRKLSCCIYIYENREKCIEKPFYINENREKYSLDFPRVPNICG